MKEKLTHYNRLFKIQKAEIEKYCLRGSFLEAYHYYEVYAFKPLVANLRAVHTPTKQGFYLKHIYQDLPDHLTKQVEGLIRVNSVEDIRVRLDKIESILNDLTIDG